MVVAPESSGMAASIVVESIMDGSRKEWVIAHCSFRSEVAAVGASTTGIVATVTSYCTFSTKPRMVVVVEELITTTDTTHFAVGKVVAGDSIVAASTKVTSRFAIACSTIAGSIFAGIAAVGEGPTQGAVAQ